VDDLLQVIFSAEGPLARAFSDFEERTQQKEMAVQVFDAYTKEEIALIEAGTGIGKSLAYLVPAMLWAVKHKEKTVISTHTIALQEQLTEKDIPVLLKALGIELKAVLLKGMSNYLCLRKLSDFQEQLRLFTEEESKELQSVENWSTKTEEGSRSEIAFPLSQETWEKVRVEKEACNSVKCPHYKRCFFFKARRKAADAQLLVVNHHLLFADLVSKQRPDFKEEKAILPPYRRLVLDEAHHVEEVALDSLAVRIDRQNLYRLLSKISTETVREALPPTGCGALVQRLEIDLPAEKRLALDKVQEAFSQLEDFLSTQAPEQKWRVRSELSEIKPSFLLVCKALRSLAQGLHSLASELAPFEKAASQAVDVQAASSRLEEQAEGLEKFFTEDNDPERVRWIEPSKSNIALIDAHLNIAQHLEEHLFEPLSTVSLCSATLTANRNFEYMKGRLGIAKRTATENCYDSPFDYEQRTLLLVPTDMPDPTDFSFNAESAKQIIQAIQASRGNAFVLFTSYDMLRKVHALVSEQVSYPCLRQGDKPRQALIESFKAQDGSVLFGTDSFWEGVDVAGEALRCVIIVKLPFKVPNDPLVEAQGERLLAQGKNPFFDFSVPQAVMKFKQGFGRLMRKKTDRGCIVCLDKRLISKSYGKLFLNSLPPCRTLFDRSDAIFQEMRNFYIRTL
jgi:ATP-dependent DNA helicase DinG